MPRDQKPDRDVIRLAHAPAQRTREHDEPEPDETADEVRQPRRSRAAADVRSTSMRASMLGVAPDKSSTPPATKVSVAATCGIDAARCRPTRQPARAQSGRAARAAPRRGTAARRPRAARGSRSRDRRAASRAARSAGTCGRTSTITASNTPRPPGTWLMQAGRDGRRIQRRERGVADVRLGRQQHPDDRACEREVRRRRARAARAPIVGPGSRSAQPRISSGRRPTDAQHEIGDHASSRIAPAAIGFGVVEVQRRRRLRGLEQQRHARESAASPSSA